MVTELSEPLLQLKCMAHPRPPGAASSLQWFASLRRRRPGEVRGSEKCSGRSSVCPPPHTDPSPAWITNRTNFTVWEVSSIISRNDKILQGFTQISPAASRDYLNMQYTTSGLPASGQARCATSGFQWREGKTWRSKCYECTSTAGLSDLKRHKAVKHHKHLA